MNWFQKQAMDAEVDHYVILGLPSGEQGAKLSEEEIKKAHRSMVKKLHPDKRPDDDNFLNLQTSFTILMDKKARQIFHQEAAKKQIKPRRKSQEQNSNSKRHQKRDVDERERVKRAAHAAAKAARDMEECIHRRNEQLIARINREAAAASKAPSAAASTLNKGAPEEAASTQRPQGDWLDKEEFSSKFGGGGFEEHENSLLTKFRKKDINDIPKHQDL